MGFRPIIKILIVDQPQKIPVLLGRSEIFWLYCLLSRHLYSKKANQSYI